MRIVVNYLSALEARTGIGHYTAELLRCLHQQAAAETIDPYPGTRGQRLLKMWMRIRRKQLATSAGPSSGKPARRTLRQRLFDGLRTCGRWTRQISFQHLCRWKKYDLYHEPNYIPLPCDRPTVVTLHDLSILLHPEWHPAERVAQFEQRFRRGLGQCIHFLTVSEFVRREVIRELGLSPLQVTRTYNGIRRGLSPLPQAEAAVVLRRLNLPSRYLLYVGTIEPRKNIKTLLHAYNALPERIRHNYPLVLVGGWGWNSADIAQWLDARGKRAGVLHLGYVPEEHLAALYNGARALVFPSLYEGFGLPPVEMLACGGAVLASTAGAVAETVGRQAHLIEPLDIDGWRRAMQRVVEDEEWWRSLRRGAVEAAKPFTWERCAADTLQVYRQLTGENVRLDKAA